MRLVIRKKSISLLNLSDYYNIDRLFLLEVIAHKVLFCLILWPINLVQNFINYYTVL
jgi:hypothetical protein